MHDYVQLIDTIPLTYFSKKWFILYIVGRNYSKLMLQHYRSNVQNTQDSYTFCRGFSLWLVKPKSLSVQFSSTSPSLPLSACAMEKYINHQTEFSLPGRAECVAGTLPDPGGCEVEGSADMSSSLSSSSSSLDSPLSLSTSDCFSSSVKVEL